MHTNVGPGHSFRHILDPDVCWDRFEGALVTMAAKIEDGVSLPAACLELICESASAILKFDQRENDRIFIDLMCNHSGSHEDNSNRARTLLRAHKDYDRLCKRLSAQKVMAAYSEGDELSAENSQHSGSLHPTASLEKGSRGLAYTHSHASTKTRNAHRSWDFVTTPVSSSP